MHTKRALLIYAIFGLFKWVFIGQAAFVAAFGYPSEYKHKYWVTLDF